MKQFEINEKNEEQRLDKFLQRILSNAGPAFVYKMLRKKNITLNDKKADGNVILQAGDVVKLYFSDETYDKMAGTTARGTGDFATENAGLTNNALNKLTFYIDIVPEASFKDSIIYEDDNIILINKPAGILSQKSSPGDVSLNEYINYYLMSSGKLSESDLKQYKPSAVNRLDRNTSGIIIAAKNLKAAALLSEGLKKRTINKYYKCAVSGSFDKEGLHSGYLSKDSLHNIVTVSSEKSSGDDNKNSKENAGAYIETEYELLEDHGDYSILLVHLITGKPHQIRAHLQYLGFPIVGDTKYGNAAINKRFNVYHQLLHAYKLIFPEYDDPMFKEISGKTFICDINFGIKS